MMKTRRFVTGVVIGLGMVALFADPAVAGRGGGRGGRAGAAATRGQSGYGERMNYQQSHSFSLSHIW